MNSTESEFHEIPVRVVNHPAARRPRYRTVFQTITITADEPAQELLPASDDRKIVYVQALDDDVVISGNRSEAAFGAGTIVRKTNTQPWPVQESGPVYVAVPTFGAATSRVTLAAVYCTYE